jgi:hypothetical protein
VCKNESEPLQTLKNNFFMTMYLEACHDMKMHQNLFLTSQDVKKYLFITMFLVAL